MKREGEKNEGSREIEWKDIIANTYCFLLPGKCFIYFILITAATP